MSNAPERDLEPLSGQEAAEIDGGRRPLPPIGIYPPVPPIQIPWELGPVF